MTQELRDYINAWLQKAQSDLMAAERLIDIEPMILDGACFHCQQAVEKSLKGFLCFHGEEIEKTHNLSFLLGECSRFDSVFNTIDTMELNNYAVLGRYPDSSLLPEPAEAKAYYQLAIQVNDLVKQRILPGLG